MSGKWLCGIAALVIVLYGGNLWAAGGGVMVWRLEPKTGVSSQDIDSISGIVVAAVERYAGQKVVSEGDIATMVRGEELRQQCGADDTSCLVEIGMAMGVPQAVSGDLGRVGSLWVVNLRRINVRTAEVMGRVSRQVPGQIEDLVMALPGVVAELFGVKAPALPGVITVTADPEGAQVSVNGRVVGQTPLRHTVEGGVYTVEITKKGYHRETRRLTVGAGDFSTLRVELRRLPMEPFVKWGHVAFWSGLGLAAFGGVATYMAYDTAGDNKAGDFGDETANRAWSGLAITGYTLGAAAMITGVVLWALAPDVAQRNSIAAAPTADGDGAVVFWAMAW